MEPSPRAGCGTTDRDPEGRLPGRERRRDRAAKRNRVFQDGVAATVTDILSDNVDGGTGTAAQTDCTYEAGKTGTTDDFNDAMFVGFTPQLSTAVWVGYPDELRSMTSVHGISVAGGTFPAQIWHDYMQVALTRATSQASSVPHSPSPRTWSSGSRSTAPSPPAQAHRPAPNRT
jgi:penicillin-binding protein 1A